jgi:hypothetical protein
MFYFVFFSRKFRFLSPEFFRTVEGNYCCEGLLTKMFKTTSNTWLNCT